MKGIILPIKSEYVKAIMEGKKKYEYRKRLCTKDIDKIYIYETAPVKKIVCAVKVVKKIGMNKEKLWDTTKDYSGISRENFNVYFAQQTNGYAYALGAIEVFEKPMNLEDFGIMYVPQGFVYVDC